MNERIRELAEQATDKWVGGEFFDREKFAESIIKECCKALNPALRDMISRGKGVAIIKEHFGVK
jgi:hypothetical protein